MIIDEARFYGNLTDGTGQPTAADLPADVLRDLAIANGVDPATLPTPEPPPPAPSRITPPIAYKGVGADRVAEIVLRMVAAEQAAVELEERRAEVADLRAELQDRSQACARLADQRAGLTREVDRLQTLLAFERAQAACACPCHRPDGDPKAVHGG